MQRRAAWFLLLGISLFARESQAAPTPNLSILKAELLQYVDSGRYLQEIAAVARQARQFVEQRATQGGGRLALVLDIDETAISNFSLFRTLDFGYRPAEWLNWIKRADAPAISPVLELYRAARQAGVMVIFITTRTEDTRAPTVLNLQRAGFTEYAELILPSGSATALTAAAFKTAARAHLTQAGYVIIANVGDQDSDLVGGNAERTFKLPNPFYLTE